MQKEGGNNTLAFLILMNQEFSVEFYDHYRYENNGFGVAGPLLEFPLHDLNLIFSNKLFF